MTHGWDPTAFQRAARLYLQQAQELEAGQRTDTGKVETSERSYDMSWAEGDESSQPGHQPMMLVRMLVIGLRHGADEHLRALIALLAVDGVGLAVETLARACCEASAQVLWLLDAEASREKRLARAYNYVMATLPPEGATSETVHAKFVAEARRLGVPMGKDRRGKVYFGERPLGRGALFRKYLDPLASGQGGSASSGRLWQRWSGSTHVDAQAGLVAVLAAGEAGNDTTASLTKGAAVMAAGAHMTAVHRVLQHSGQLEEPQDGLAWETAMAPLVLTFIR